MTSIYLEGMEFHGFHGVHSEEKKLGGKYIVDLHVEADIPTAATSDDLADTVDYEALYQCIVKEVDKPCHLLEHLASNMAKRVLAYDNRIICTKVSVKKINPPMPGIIRAATVVHEEHRK